MPFYNILILLIVAGLCGAMAQTLAGFSKGGCILSIILGFIGALIGSWIAKHFNFPDFYTVQIGGRSFPVVWSVIGGIIFTALLGARHPRK